jgi:hypothetical protein
MQAKFQDGLEVTHSLKSLQFRPSVAMPNFKRVIAPPLDAVPGTPTSVGRERR